MTIKSHNQQIGFHMKQKLAILRYDAWLEPYSEAIEGRHQDVIKKFNEIT